MIDALPPPSPPPSHPPARARRYEVLVNARAGAVLEIGAAELRRRLEAAFAAAGAAAEVHLGSPPELTARLAALTDPSTVPVIVGGDGTVHALLPTLLARGDGRLPFGLLPMGSMNLLGRDLGLVGDLDVDVRALHAGRAVAIDLATLNGVPFHSASGLGFAVVVAHEREQARRLIPFSVLLATIVAAARALLRTRPVEVEVEVDGQSTHLLADGVLVTNNVFEGSPWRRPRLDEGTLEVHLLAAPTFLARTRAALAVVTGEWRALRHLTSLRARSVTLRRPGRLRTRVTLDGEVVRQRAPLAYAILPKALRVLAADPRPAALAGEAMSDAEAVGAEPLPEVREAGEVGESAARAARAADPQPTR